MSRLSIALRESVMSGWFYMKDGLLDSVEKGPLSTETMLQMAFDGSLKLKTLMRHETHTRNQWCHLEQVPAAKNKIEEGVTYRRAKAEAEKAAKENEVRMRAEAKERERLEKERQRNLIVTREPERQSQENTARPKQGMLLDSTEASQSPFRGPPSAQPQPTYIHVAAPQQQERLDASGWFTRAFSTTAGVLMCLMFVFVGVPILLCGGCLTLSVIGMGSTSRISNDQTPATPRQATKEKDPVVVYAPISDMFCATDPEFLDLSPLSAPVRFARVLSGTEVVIVNVGGVLSGKMYYELSAGGKTKVYVYRDVFDQKFEKMRVLENSTQ